MTQMDADEEREWQRRRDATTEARRHGGALEVSDVTCEFGSWRRHEGRKGRQKEFVHGLHCAAEPKPSRNPNGIYHEGTKARSKCRRINHRGHGEHGGRRRGY